MSFSILHLGPVFGPTFGQIFFSIESPPWTLFVVSALPLYEGEVHGEEGLLPEGAAGRYLQGGIRVIRKAVN